MRGVILCLVLMYCMQVIAAEQGFTDREEARYQGLINQLRCLVCQNQTIAESNAPLAQDLRRQVQNMILQGKDDEAILDFLTQRYGDFVLYRPPVKRMTWLLWGGPFGLLFLALLVALLIFRRRPAATPPAPDAAALQRLLDNKDP